MVRWSEEDLANFRQNSGRGISKDTQAEIAKNKKLAKLSERAGELVKAGAVKVKAPEAGARKHKYDAQPVTVDGIRFDSKLEARRYCELVLLQQAGKIAYFLRQVPFHLPGGVIYRCDFMVIYQKKIELSPGKFGRDPGGECRVFYEDCKGFDRQDAINKRKQVKALYGVDVVLVRRASKGRVP